MNPAILLAAAAAGLAVWWLLNRNNEAHADPEPEPSPAVRDPAKPGRTVIEVVIPPLPDRSAVVIPTPTPAPSGPGSSPSNPKRAKDVFRGFHGYIKFEEGDYPSVVAARLGTTHDEFVRQNPILVTNTPTWVYTKHNNGRPTFSVYPRWGWTPGVDCIEAPGYKAEHYSKYTGTFPIAEFWG